LATYHIGLVGSTFVLIFYSVVVATESKHVGFDLPELLFKSLCFTIRTEFFFHSALLVVLVNTTPIRLELFIRSFDRINRSVHPRDTQLLLLGGRPLFSFTFAFLGSLGN
ncbi:uncharacterized protein B0P05DRAFT_624834, partial [Gilbertella persicaria]|uniref:uncharacterized protein n=1 Tax=Gilbertella persicaria TaxID=101096 RepID=UPI002220B5D9